ncbi:unnamed protein product [Ectocarpus sp. 8 AP-2014]
MGAAGSVGVVDPAALRKEYEAMAAKDVGDEELLNHMKKLIISPQTGAVDKAKTKEAAPNVEGTRRSSVRRSSAAASEVDSAAAAGPKARRGSGGIAASGVKGGTAGSTARRGSASRPLSHNSRLSQSSSSTQASQQRRASNARRSSVDGDRPLSAPQTKPPIPKQRPRSSLGEKNDGSGKPTKSRRRSYLGQPTAGQGGNAVGAAAAVAVDAAAAVDGTAPAQDEPVKDEPAQDVEDMKIDSWESVSQQPSCPLCHMVFSTEGKRDQHIKYSPAHAPPAEGSNPPPEPTMDSITIYSGSKLFWRTGLNVEMFMQQHKTANNVVQAMIFDASTYQELAQVWVCWSAVVANLDAKEMKKEMDAAERAFHNLGMKPTPENVLAEATRKAAVSFIIKRIQVDRDESREEAGGPAVSHKVSMLQMAADEDGMQLLVEKPEGVNDTFSRAMTKRASIQEVAEVMTSLRKSLGDVNTAAQAAAASLVGATGTVEQGRRGSVEVARRASIQGS